MSRMHNAALVGVREDLIACRSALTVAWALYEEVDRCAQDLSRLTEELRLLSLDVKWGTGPVRSERAAVLAQIEEVEAKIRSAGQAQRLAMHRAEAVWASAPQGVRRLLPGRRPRGSEDLRQPMAELIVYMYERGIA